MLISRKLVQGRGIEELVENAVFSLLAGRHQRVKITHLQRDLDAHCFLKPRPKLGFF